MENFDNPKLYFNRELSWLRFNTRVLAQAKKQEDPLLERLKFLAIYATNLDEFYMIRVAGLKQLFSARVVETGIDKLTPLDQLRGIRKYLHKEKLLLEDTYTQIAKELVKEELNIKNYDDLSDELKKEADEYFHSNIFPVIIPITVDATHPFPHLNNLSFALAVKLQDLEKQKTIYGMIRIPRVVSRFIQIGKSDFVPIESIVRNHIEDIFDGFELIEAAAFRVTRNADIIIEEEEADDFIEIMEEGLKSRRKGAFVRLEIQKSATDEMVEFLNNHFKIFEKDIYRYNIPINLGTLWQIVGNKNFSNLLLKPFKPKILPPFESSKSIFQSLNETEALLFHPFESFDPVTKLVTEAAKDPDVLSIRMTLYRVEKQSPIVKALIDAANNDKQVTVMVELKARFDEENNLLWARVLENSGAHVVYGVPGFKVHAKALQVIKRVNGKLKFYVHLGTGNYNGASAKIYSDVSYFTTKEHIAQDITHFFHYLTGHAKHPKLNHLKMSPTQTKKDILSMIKNEEKFENQGRIILKANSLVDTDIIQALYLASNAGVKIDLIIRGICNLKPGVKGVSENISVRSIIGKYLEHARIYYFKNSTPNIFIASADLMPRNLERRFELMTPIEDEKLANTLQELLNLQLADNTLAWNLQENGEYKQVLLNDNETKINCHDVLENYINKVYKSLNKAKTKSKASVLAKKLLKES
jgi:polyphosphate kinase